ncbi:MAG: F0F1 ATP synthase subunit A [Bacteroidales bacterium]
MRFSSIIISLGMFFTICLYSPMQASEKSLKAEPAFNAGELIFDHVLDNHKWHIAEVGETEISVPLPIILWQNGKLYCFSSNKFDKNGIYKNFQLRTQAPYKGKIVSLKLNAKGQKVISKNLPLDFSITKTVAGLMISAMLLFLIFMTTARSYKKRGIHAPKGIQSIVEPIFMFIRDEAIYNNLGKKYGKKFLPYLMCLFFFIAFNNLSGLIPIFPFGANLMGNISVTLVLALFTFFLILANSGKEYWRHIFNTPGVPWWMKFPIPLMPIIEFMEIFTKPFILMIRLFANITAGHVVILGFVCIIFIFGDMSSFLGYALSPVSILFSLFVNALEILVAFIQAYIFTFLTSMYLAGALGYQANEDTEHLS